MVCKQTELTPMTAMLLADILYDAGLPPEMFSVITGWPQEIGLEMIQNPNIDLITFTGSVGVGKYIAEKAGYKRTVLELGGNVYWEEARPWLKQVSKMFNFDTIVVNKQLLDDINKREQERQLANQNGLQHKSDG